MKVDGDLSCHSMQKCDSGNVGGAQGQREERRKGAEDMEGMEDGDRGGGQEEEDIDTLVRTFEEPSRTSRCDYGTCMHGKVQGARCIPTTATLENPYDLSVM